MYAKHSVGEKTCLGRIVQNRNSLDGLPTYKHLSHPIKLTRGEPKEHDS